MTSDAEPGSESLSERHFFLAVSPDRGPGRLLPEDQEHALRVLRLEPGDTIVGLDGCGQAWPLRVASVGRHQLELETAGPPRREPRPGESGATLPWIEVAVPLPKPARQHEMVDRLTQLGASRIVPLVTDRTTAVARTLSPNRLEKLRRVTREACKQSRRLWTLEFDEPRTLEHVLQNAEGSLLHLSPTGDLSLADWSRELLGAQSRAELRKLTLLVGPEGGFSPAECARLDSLGALACRLTPTILRIETAAELAVGTLAQVLQNWSASRA